MTATKSLVYALVLTLLVLAGADHSSGQSEKKPEKSKEEKELIARCKTRPIKNALPKEPKNWKWEKGEKYHGGPTISYTIEEDGTVTNVKLKRSSAVRKIDEYYVAWVKGSKYEAMPGCSGIDTAFSITIDFQ
jgi:TonB family protein